MQSQTRRSAIFWLTRSILGSIEGRIARRTLYLWLLTRLVVALFMLLLGQPPLKLSPISSAIVIGTVYVLAYSTVRASNEDLMLRNLGTSPLVIASLCFGPPLMVELVAGLAA
jgi:hypothetical protein